MGTQFGVETCCAKKVWKNVSTFVIGGSACKNFFIVQKYLW
jgi:hypothetical protein